MQYSLLVQTRTALYLSRFAEYNAVLAKASVKRYCDGSYSVFDPSSVSALHYAVNDLLNDQLNDDNTFIIPVDRNCYFRTYYSNTMYSNLWYPAEYKRKLKDGIFIISPVLHSEYQYDDCRSTDFRISIVFDDAVAFMVCHNDFIRRIERWCDSARNAIATDIEICADNRVDIVSRVGVLSEYATLQLTICIAGDIGALLHHFINFVLEYGMSVTPVSAIRFGDHTRVMKDVMQTKQFARCTE